VGNQRALPPNGIQDKKKEREIYLFNLTTTILITRECLAKSLARGNLLKFKSRMARVV